MKKKKLICTLLLCMILVVAGLTGCGDKKKEAEKVVESVAEKEEAEREEDKEESSDRQESAEEKDSEENTNEDLKETESEEAEEKANEGIDALLEKYYEEVLVEEEGLIELPSGYEVGITERHLEGYSIGEAYFNESGICYHATWDYDKDEQDEMLVLLMGEDKDYERSKLYARMYEVKDGEVVEAAELESFFGWMEFDTNQSTEIFLRETKDWFYLAEEAKGYSSIYADGSAYAIRVAHYDGTDFVVDLAKQMSGSDFSETEEEVADTARLLTYVGFDNTAENLTYEYNFNRKDDLLSVFYITAEHMTSLDKFYHSGNISDVSPFIILGEKPYL